MRAFTRPFLLALVLVPIATAACAENEWVLWLHSEYRQTGDYSLQGRYPTKEECQKETRDLAETMKRLGYAVTVGEPSDPYVIGEREPAPSLKYFCLPNAVDPHQQKAK